MASRLPVRILVRHARSQCSRRTFTSSASALEAQNFTMPAMSPTMTEGNISKWNVKEGDSFSTGDVLLEIETDKATMDVEAQDDGIMAKIISQDGSKGVKVGTRIAVLAEPGDDIASLEIPEEDSKPVQKEAESKKEDKSAEPPIQSASSESKGDPSTKGSQEMPSQAKPQPKQAASGPGQNPKYPLYPSVMALISQNHISEGDVSKIPASGPNGRLLKGDVLAYLGLIEADYSKNQSKRIEHASHLDLSNIKIAPKSTAKQEVGAPTAATTPELPRESTISIPISLSEVLKVQKRIQDTLGVAMPLSTFLARAVDYANDDLPLTKNSKPSQDALFNAVLGLSSLPKTSRGTYLPQIDALPITNLASRSAAKTSAARPSNAKKQQLDIMDVLTGKARPVRSAMNRNRVTDSLYNTAASSPAGIGALNVFTVTVPAGEEKRARTFLERMKTVLQVEPGRLVL